MPYAANGKHFPTQQQVIKYERSLGAHPATLAERGESDFSNAPSGNPVTEGAKHGVVVKSSYERLPGGGHRINVTHVDGHEWTQTHPEEFRAHQILTQAHGFDEQPPAIKTHMKNRAHPTGPKEDERLAREDSREIEETEDGK